MPDTKIMICPIVAYQGRDWSGDSYQTNNWQIGDYGGWETEAASVYYAYMWMAGFDGHAPGSVTVQPNELMPPMHAAEGKASERVIITHRLNFYNGTALHEVCHEG